MRLLTIDNGNELPQGYINGFVRAGFKGDRVSGFKKGEWMLIQNNYDLVIISGGEPAAAILFIKETMHNIFKGFILVLSSQSSTEDRVAFYQAGVDEILVPPFSFLEVLAKVKLLAVREKRRNFRQKFFSLDDLFLDLERYRVFRGGKEIKLRKKEFDLLYYLAINEGIVLNKTTILEAVWDFNIELATNTLEVHILALRRKVDRGHDSAKRLIHTVYGRGYYFGLSREIYSSSLLASGSF